MVMLRFLLLLVIVIGGFWAYNNIDFNELSNSAINILSNEKTIKKFHQADKLNKDAIDESLNKY